jgi:hypothetical protein
MTPTVGKVQVLTTAVIFSVHACLLCSSHIPHCTGDVNDFSSVQKTAIFCVSHQSVPKPFLHISCKISKIGQKIEAQQIDQNVSSKIVGDHRSQQMPQYYRVTLWPVFPPQSDATDPKRRTKKSKQS